MKLADLIRKNSLIEVATAIPAIPATEPFSMAPSVAGIATIAVANPTSEISAFREWRVSYPSAEPMTVLFTPPATRAEVTDVYRGAVIEPMPASTTRTATAAETDELRELVATVLGDGGDDDECVEALTVALADPRAALASLRDLARGADDPRRRIATKTVAPINSQRIGSQRSSAGQSQR